MAATIGMEGDFGRLSLKNPDAKLDGELECHFKWKPDIGGSNTKLPGLEEKLLRDLDERPLEKIETYSLLGYIITLDPDSNDPDKSKEYFEKALEEAGDSDDKRFVAEANLLINRKESGDFRGIVEDTTKLQEKWRHWKKEEPHMFAYTHGCHAFALSKFGHNKEDAAIEQYGKAIELDSENWMWVLGKAKTLERKRAFHTREEKPSNETLELFEKAMELSHSDELVSALYANCLVKHYQLTYCTRKRSQHEQSNQEKFHLEGKIKDLIQEARHKGFREKRLSVLKRCCKGYKDLKWWYDLRNCLDTAIHMAPEDDSLLLHQLAQYFMNSHEKDFNQAKRFLERSVNCSPSGNMNAALDLIKVRAMQKEDIDVDHEYKKVLKKYKPVITSNALIHDYWARSLQKLEPDRILDQALHLKEAIKLYDPKFVQERVPWVRFESICSGVFRNPNRKGDIKYHQACRDLSWIYYVPEPKTPDNLRNAEKYLSYLKEDEFEEDDIELYGKVLCGLNKCEEALLQFEKLENCHKNKKFHQASCFFHLGRLKSNNPDLIEDAIDLLLKSTQNGCLDACQLLLHLMMGRDREIKYQYSAYVNICLENPQKFALEENLEIKSKIIKSKLEDILGISEVSGLQEIRKHLLAMCTNDIRLKKPSLTTNREDLIVVLENAKDVLRKARSVLDHLHNQLQAKICPGSKYKVYFPLITDKQTQKDISPGSPEAKEWALENILKRFKNDFGDKDGSKGVADKCKDLIEFIAFHQPYTDPVRYEWFHDAWDVVNVIKHTTDITELEWCIPGKEQKVNLLELAQKLAFYAEDMLQEYCKLL